MGTYHRDFGKSDSALHRFGYWSDTDPSATYGTGDTGVQPGQAWIQHESGDPDTLLHVWIRNNANTAWVELPVKDHTHYGDDILVEETEETGTSYTLALTDAGTMVKLTNASSIVLTVPLDAAVAFPTGTQILIQQGGAGQVTIQGDSGVAVNTASGNDITDAQYSVAALVKEATDTWVLYGDLTS